MNRIPGGGNPMPSTTNPDRPPLNQVPQIAPVPPVLSVPLNPTPGMPQMPPSPEVPAQLNPVPGVAPSFGQGYAQPPQFASSPFAQPQGYAPPVAQPVARAQDMAPVATAAVPVAPPKPPPPPAPRPRDFPYFRCGVRRNERRNHVSASGHRYTCKPPIAQHPLLASTPRVQLAPQTLVPPSMDLRGLLGPVRDQGKEGACSGFATAAFRELLHTSLTGALLPGYLSPAYLYGRTRMLEGTFPRDSGASLSDELLILSQYGVCPEDFLPYDSDPSEAPTSACDVAAVMFRAGGLQQIDWSNGGVTIKAALAAKQPVVMSFTVYESFEEPNSDGSLPMFDPSERVLGGHAVLIVGYNDFGWMIRNQWGSSWGDDGHVYAPFGYENCFMECWSAPPQA